MAYARDKLFCTIFQQSTDRSTKSYPRFTDKFWSVDQLIWLTYAFDYQWSVFVWADDGNVVPITLSKIMIGLQVRYPGDFGYDIGGLKALTSVLTRMRSNWCSFRYSPESFDRSRQRMRRTHFDGGLSSSRKASEWRISSRDVMCRVYGEKITQYDWLNSQRAKLTFSKARKLVRWKWIWFTEATSQFNQRLPRPDFAKYTSINKCRSQQ